jgi:hypothetical protein
LAQQESLELNATQEDKATMTEEPYCLRIVIGRSDSETEAERRQLTQDFVERIISSGVVSAASIRRESDRPGETMAAGTILSLDLAGKAVHTLLEAVRSWLASRRTQIEIQTRGRKVKISAANFEEAIKIWMKLPVCDWHLSFAKHGGNEASFSILRRRI